MKIKDHLGVNNIIRYIKKRKKRSIALAIFLVYYIFCLPTELFNNPTATVIESKEGHLLGAQIATDGQWRFPACDSVPNKFEQCILQFEDAHFYKHPGFNPIAIFKALKTNISEGKVVRGGSTLTQQVIRLSRKNKSRTYIEKLIELIQATRLEVRLSKEDILKLYAAHAPFGGNVVGLEMAAWRYFGVQAHQLSWAESATLAVLPNAPGLIYPGKNQQRLLKKRNRLLKKLQEENIIDNITYNLALEEPLPQQPFPIPQMASHLLQHIAKKHKGERVRTSIPYGHQQQINAIAQQHYNIQKQNEVHNLAILVLDVKTRKVLSYIGNSPTTRQHQKDVDIIQAPRSTGSVLKPLLYMAMLNDGTLLPEALVADIPTKIANYEPENYNLEYTGAVSAKKALARSLNVPAVRLLNQYGLEKFYDELQQFKLRHINKGVDHYGLSVILGGAESNLWDLCNAYAGLSGTVSHYTQTSSEYYSNEFLAASYLNNSQPQLGSLQQEPPIFDAGSTYLGLEAMKEVNRPDGDEAWQYYDSSKEIAWKTGTSFGNRDAWAIGVTPNYVVGVWVGNADGEGRPNLTGVAAAGPILFDVFNVLPKTNWFASPLDALEEATTCTKSGYLAGPHCPEKVSKIPIKGQRTKVCPYHKLVHLDAQQQFRVNSSCEAVEHINTVSWFTLPPLMEWYYKRHQVHYKTLPPWRDGCQGNSTITMDFIVPRKGGGIILPKNLDEKTNKLILKIAHSNPDSAVHWYVDDQYIETTRTFHELAIVPSEGDHIITVVDNFGNEIKRKISIKL